MDTQRLILFFVFSFSLLLLWDSWQKEHRPPVPTIAQSAQQGPAQATVPSPSVPSQATRDLLGRVLARFNTSRTDRKSVV